MFEGLAQPMHLLVILLIALLFFGPSKIGDFGKGLGDGIRHFKDALRDGGQKANESKPAAAKNPEVTPAKSPEAAPVQASNEAPTDGKSV